MIPELATFAGGCFWCMEPPFARLKGVLLVVPGYTGGSRENPAYEEVSSGTTGHIEAVRVEYHPAKLSYEKLLDVFWRQIDPMDAEGQFSDKGSQYKTAIFFHSQEQKRLAEESKRRLERERFGRPLATLILPAAEFYMAEEYHRQFHKKDPRGYKSYRLLSGREEYRKNTWGE
ncbi:MAG: peptide-methionine (S)-S-oxide reductase MsrA [Candidatus Altiarchaeota archaeon]